MGRNVLSSLLLDVGLRMLVCTRSSVLCTLFMSKARPAGLFANVLFSSVC